MRHKYDKEKATENYNRSYLDRICSVCKLSMYYPNFTYPDKYMTCITCGHTKEYPSTKPIKKS